MENSITKKCKKCGEVKNVSEFYYSKFWKQYRSPCKKCVSVRASAYSKKYYVDNLEKVLKYGKEYSRKYYARNKEKILEYSKKYNEAHKEEHSERTKQWKEKNPDAVHAQRHKRRALRKGREGSYTAKEWHDLCEKYGNKCLCCGEKAKLTADHVVPLSEGGTNYIENIQPLCLSCNSKKYTKIIDYR